MAAIIPPSDFQITSQTATSITLSWTNNDAYTSLQIAYGLYSFGDFPFNAPDTSPQSTSATIANLTPNTQYQFKLFVTKDVDLPTVLPPTLTIENIFDSQIFFTIQADPRASSTYTEVSITPTFNAPLTITGIGALSVSSLTPYTTYYFRSRSLGDNVEYESSDWSDTVVTRTTHTLTPPSIIDKIPTATSVSFTVTSVPFAASYLTEASITPEFDVLLYTSSSSGGHVIVGLTEDELIYIRAKAISSDFHTDSEWSFATIVTLPPPNQLPAPIPISVIDNGDGTLTLLWGDIDTIPTPDNLSILDQNDSTLLFNWTP